MIDINPNDITNQSKSDVQNTQQQAEAALGNVQQQVEAALGNAQSTAENVVGGAKDLFNNIKGAISKFKPIKPIKLKELPTPKKFKNKRMI